MNRRSVLLSLLTLTACRPGQKGPDAATLDAGKAFMAANAKADGVTVLASGLQYKVVRAGPAAGMRPLRGDEVKVNYEGRLLPDNASKQGRVFDSSYERGVPAALPLDGLIPGWIEALQLMRPGDEWMLYLPPDLAYGDSGVGDIPPGSTLVFRIELIAILPGPEHLGQG